MIDVSEAYEKLRLQPLDTHIQWAVRNNDEVPVRWSKTKPKVPRTEAELYKGIGATTWMCVRAAIALMEGKEVTVIEPDGLQLASKQVVIRNALINLARDKDALGQLWASDGTFEYSNGSVLRMRLVAPSGTRGVIFADREWKERAIRRAKGPYKMAREVRLIEDRFLAYAEEDEFLFETDERGAIQLHANDPNITLIGFNIEAAPEEGGFLGEGPKLKRLA